MSSVVKAVFSAIRAVAEKQGPTEVDVLSGYSKLAVFLDEIVIEVSLQLVRAYGTCARQLALGGP